MPFISIFRQFSYVWKQTVATTLLIITLGSVLIYVYVHKQYMALLEQDYMRHWNAMQELQYTLEGMEYTSDSLRRFVDMQQEVLLQVADAFFQDIPDVFRLSLLTMDRILVFGKESQEITTYFQTSSSSSFQRAMKNTKPQNLIRQTHCVELPISFGSQQRGILRGEFLANHVNSIYIRIAKGTLYITIVASVCIVLFGIIMFFSRINRHLSLKQTQLEDYALSLEQINERLRNVKKELHVSEKLASLGYLAAGIAHEIGNPLGAVLGYVEFLEKSRLEQEKTEDILRRIKHETERIRRIIQELVNFSRPRALNIHNVDINQVLRKVISELPVGDEKQVDIQLMLTAFPLFAAVDEYKLQSVFVNIVSNSLDAIESQGEIRISTLRRIRQSSTMIGGSEVIAIQFADTGTGISEDDLPKIFDPFFTTKEPGSGMGLGLSLCHRIIESLNGEMEVRSIQGVGTEVSVFFPPARKQHEERHRNA